MPALSAAAARSYGERLFCVLDSPLGPIRIEEDETGIAFLQFTGGETPPVPPPADSRCLRATEAQLREYFAGQRRAFDLPLSLRGTDFQRRVWKALLDIPYGETLSYGDIAATAGNPRAARAVGMANHRNPVWILVPCHRVVGRNGALTGYAGGLERKAFLLRLEQTNR